MNDTAINVNAYTALTGGGYAPSASSYDARGNTLRLPRRDGGGLLAVERAAAGSSTWEIRHVHMDANGNVLCLTDAQGQASARYRYDGFGNVLQAQDLDSSGWAARNLHRFSTKPEVAGTGLLYYGYRWYDPVTGRWPSRDPIEESGG